MNVTDSNDYGLWSLVLINSLFFILFAASFFKPQTRQDWRALGMFSAFVVALFTERLCCTNEFQSRLLPPDGVGPLPPLRVFPIG